MIAALHRHRWEARGVTLMETAPGYLFSNQWQQRGDGAPLTEVVYVCGKCGDSKTKRLTGHWTLEQLTA